MKTTRFTEEQIIRILKQAEAGRPLKELSREHGISHSTFYSWKARFGGMEVSDARRLKAMEDENRKLKRIVADLTLEVTALKDINSKKW